MDLGLQCVEAALPARDQGELVEPLDQAGELRCVQLVEAVTADEGVADQPALPQHPQMAADGGPADREPVGDLACREALIAQHDQDVSPHRVGDRRRQVVHEKHVTSLLRVWQGPATGGSTPAL